MDRNIKKNLKVSIPLSHLREGQSIIPNMPNMPKAEITCLNSPFPLKGRSIERDGQKYKKKKI